MMRLYLVQHGVALSEAEDPSRPLSAEGREAAERVAERLVACGVEVERIYHSPKARAVETAEIFATRLVPGEVVESEGLAPKDDPHLWRDRLKGEGRDTMLVGHLPHLSRLAALLLGGEGARETIGFTNAGVLCLQRGEAGDWSLAWMLVPELCPR